MGGKELSVKFQIILHNCNIVFVYLAFLLKIVPCFCAASEIVKELFVPSVGQFSIKQASDASQNVVLAGTLPVKPSNQPPHRGQN